MSRDPDTSLRARFESAARDLGASREVESTARSLLAAWDEPRRIRHGRIYLEEGLSLVTELAAVVEAPALLELAWWFHYVALATGPFADVARRSADIAYESCARMGIDRDIAERLRRMIRATRDHEVPAAMREDRSCAALVDIDLAVLGADPLTFARNERDLDEEARWSFCDGVRIALRRWTFRRHLARTTIFALPEMRLRFEAQARRNLQNAVRTHPVGPRERFVLNADDHHVFATREGRLEDTFAWEELTHVMLFPQSKWGPARLALEFGRIDITPREVVLDDPDAVDVIARLRALPGYRRDLEGQTKGVELLYTRERCGPVTTPLLPIRPSSAYR